MDQDMKLFVPITKVDVAKQLIYGVLAEEKRDRSGEIMDYARSKPHFQKWSGMFKEATGGKSAGNLRVMHTEKVAGHFTEVVLNDEMKRVEVVAKVNDPVEWQHCLDGDYTGLSIGGRYVARWQDDMDKSATRHEAAPGEGSLVDMPCMFGATFSVLKADGSEELVKFKNTEPEEKVTKIRVGTADLSVITRTDAGHALIAKFAAGEVGFAPGFSADEPFDEIAAGAAAGKGFEVKDGLLKRIEVKEPTICDKAGEHVFKAAMGKCLCGQQEVLMPTLESTVTKCDDGKHDFGKAEKCEKCGEPKPAEKAAEPVEDLTKMAPADAMAKAFTLLTDLTKRVVAVEESVTKAAAAQTAVDEIKKASETMVKFVETYEPIVKQLADSPAEVGRVITKSLPGESETNAAVDIAETAIKAAVAAGANEMKMRLELAAEGIKGRGW